MTVIIEGISIVIRAKSLAVGFSNWQSFLDWVPNKTLCCDGELARIGFMSPSDVSSSVSNLEHRGIRYLVDRQSLDIAVVDQLHGLCCSCDWLEVGTMPYNGDEAKPIMAAKLIGGKNNLLMLPDNWDYRSSLTMNYRFIPTPEIEHSFADIDDSIPGQRAFIDFDGKKWFMNRTNIPKD